MYNGIVSQESKRDGSPMKNQEIYDAAFTAGMEAGKAAIPEPMIVVERENPFDDSSAIVKEYAPVMDGPCGFATVTVRPGSSSFAKFLRKSGVSHKAYYGGEEFFVHEFGQSVTRKYAFAVAFAAVVKEAGITAYAASRLD